MYFVLSLLHLAHMITVSFDLQNIFCIKIKLLYYALLLLHLVYHIYYTPRSLFQNALDGPRYNSGSA